MEITVLIFLTSGLFLGWSLGANDAANVFGTAVASRMIQFTTAAIICTVFLILGAVISGAGAAHGLGALGKLNALPGAFMAAFSAALTVYWMTKAGLPVSTTQAIVGAIIGWNFFSSSITDLSALTKILATWVACPILGAIFGALIYKLVMVTLSKSRIHLLRLDGYTRLGLILAGAFGSYSLGANNIGNVMGVFVSSSPFSDFSIAGLFTLTSIQQLFLLGAIAIGVGVFTYSKRVMMTVGDGILPLTPVGAWVVVISHSIVLFLFSSITLEHFLASNGLPTIPLIPVSSSQAVVGAVIGIGLLKGGKGIKWRALGNIASGWVTTPIIASIVCFVMLFFLQNVFNQVVYHEVRYVLSEPVLNHLERSGVTVAELTPLKDREITGGVPFRDAVREVQPRLPGELEEKILDAAEIYPISISDDKLMSIDADYLSPEQIGALDNLVGLSLLHKWQLYDTLSRKSGAWRKLENNKLNKPFNKHLDEQLNYVYGLFHQEERGAKS
ncbi:MAG: inorganic phosphate transporter [Gammaproteobacteria bacterium]|nr:inorganic phosphate transporter [Gammaproteobacteria bacterium]